MRQGDKEKGRMVCPWLLSRCLCLDDIAEVEAVIAGEDIAEGLVAKPLGDDLAQHVAEVSRHLKVAGAVELLGAQARPLAVDLATGDVATEHEHRVAMTVVGAAAAVLGRAPPELAHRYDRHLAE